MPGGQVPDDWDGETYECLQLQWPSSEKWRALLLGQVSEPGSVGFWDPNSGDPEEAAFAVSTAYEQTVAQDQLECEEPVEVETLPPSWFRAEMNASQATPANQWVKLVFDKLAGFGNNFGYVTGLQQHIPDSFGTAGIWHYSLSVSLTGPGSFWVRLRIGGGPAVARTRIMAEETGLLSATVDVTAPSQIMQAEIFTIGPQNIQNATQYTFWTGHFLGEQ